MDTATQTEIEVAVFDYTKEARFALVRKLPRVDRFRCDFKYLHKSRELAEEQAIKMTKRHGHKFYIVEVVAITSGPDFRPGIELMLAAAPPMPSLADQLSAEVVRMAEALDKIYNHNEAARTAVVEHYGAVHSPLVREAIARMTDTMKV